MAHRKLQQEIDRVFKKINEGLEIFDMYYERHENCVNNPSQKDKLESDLKREVKKLQRLREQIKSWQSSPEVKDKDALLNYRRSVEVAMEKYKAVEKASKEKAYSNISLKRSDVLDPQEQERREVEDFLSQQIEELERQFDLLQIEVDRLILLQKKRKTATPENEKELQRFKDLQARYRYHQQQMELALRLIANEELETQQVRDIEDEILYFVEENQMEGFIEDDSLYEGLDLQSNEAIAHEVAAAFASRLAGDGEGADVEGKDGKLSKKELRRLEREAKKNAKSTGKGTTPEENPTPVITGKPTTEIGAKQNEPDTNGHTSFAEIQTPPSSKSASPSPPSTAAVTETALPTTAGTTAPSKPHTPLTKGAVLSTESLQQSQSQDEQPHAFTHIHQSLNGLTTTTLKPAPLKPVNENKWALATERKLASLKAKSMASTPVASKVPLVTTSMNHASTVASSTTLSPKAAESTPAISNGSRIVNNESFGADDSQSNTTASAESVPMIDEFSYDNVSTDDELDEEPSAESLSSEQLSSKLLLIQDTENSLLSDLELMVLPAGIKDMIMGSVISKNKLYPNNGKLGGFRRFYDTCQRYRLKELPGGVYPPQPLDVTRSIQQWDQIILSINVADYNVESIVTEFEKLETFTLFYQYYYSVTPLEQKICDTLLKQRGWRVLKSGDCWFLRQGDVKFSNEQCEVADYKIFKMDIWTVVDKINFKLDYALLADADTDKLTTGVNLIQEAVNDPGSSKQLLQALNRGKVEYQ